MLAREDIEEMIKKGACVKWGDFAENITTEGINLSHMLIGAILNIGETVLEATQVGKECHQSRGKTEGKGSRLRLTPLSLNIIKSRHITCYKIGLFYLLLTEILGLVITWSSVLKKKNAGEGTASFHYAQCQIKPFPVSIALIYPREIKSLIVFSIN